MHQGHALCMSTSSSCTAFVRHVHVTQSVLIKEKLHFYHYNQLTEKTTHLAAGFVRTPNKKRVIFAFFVGAPCGTIIPEAPKH